MSGGYIPPNADPHLKRALDDIWTALNQKTSLQSEVGSGLGASDIELIKSIARSAVSDSTPTESSPSEPVLNFGMPVPVGTALSEGSSPYASRADHVHSHLFAGGALVGTALASIPNNTNTIMSWIVSFPPPTSGYFDAGAPDRIITPVPGIYVMGCNFRWAASAVGIREIQIQNLAGSVMGASTIVGNARAGLQSVGIALLRTAGEPIRVQVFQDSGGPLNVTVAQFWVYRMLGNS